MARTVSDIKKQMTDAFIANSTIRDAYSITDVNATFDNTFSKVSLESILFYIVAFAIYTLEYLFDVHVAQVNTIISEQKTPTLRWFVNKVKAFRFGIELLPGTDNYPNTKTDGTAYTDEEITALQVVKYAAGSEDGKGVVYIKVAGAGPAKLTDEQEQALVAYLKEIKPAGVPVVVRNATADVLRLTLTVYYNPMLLSSTGASLSAGGYPVVEAIKSYISNLPFNGEYRNASLIDTLQKVSGVVIPELQSAQGSFDNETFTQIAAKAIPYSGYYNFDESNSQITYIAYENISD